MLRAFFEYKESREYRESRIWKLIFDAFTAYAHGSGAKDTGANAAYRTPPSIGECSKRHRSSREQKMPAV